MKFLEMYLNISNDKQRMTTETAKVFQTLYTTNARQSIQMWQIRVIQDEHGNGIITTTRGLVGGKLQEHSQVIQKGKNIGKRNETSPYTQAIAEAQSKWNDKKRKNGYTEEMPVSGEAKVVSTVGSVSPMLAKDFKNDSNKLKWEEGVVCQVKLDGVRALCGIEQGEVFLKSRGNKYYHNLRHIKDAFRFLYTTSCVPHTVLFDCELYSTQLKFEDITGICRKQKELSEVEQDIELKIEAHVFDLFDISQPELEFGERYDRLTKIIGSDRSPLVIVDTWTGFSIGDLDEVHERARNEGYEGIMLRNEAGKYKPGPTRSNDLIKMKAMMDQEFPIVDFREGVGQETGTVIWVCETENGAQFSVRPMGTRERRKEWFNNGEQYLGELLTVRFQEWSKDMIPRFPVGVGIRDYE
jgi:DNA ligase-1